MPTYTPVDYDPWKEAEPMTAESDELVRQAAAAQQLQEAQFQKDATEIEKLGREHFGNETFDQAVNTLASKLGDGIRTVTQVIIRISLWSTSRPTSSGLSAFPR
jgi:hypothetical protein